MHADLSDRSILITGGAGFIGSHLADRLLAGGARVSIVDDLSTGARRNVPEGAAFTEASILDFDHALLDGVDAVVHLAAVVSVPESVEDPAHCHAVNVTGTAQLLEASRDANVRRFVLASSCAVYGGDPSLPSRESDAIDPLSPYAASKAAAEAFTAAFGRCCDLDTVSLRFFNVFGPRQDPRSPYAAVVAAFFDALREGRPVRFDGDGEQTRDFIAVANIVDALTRAAATKEPLNGVALNVGTGRGTSLLTLLETMSRLTETTPAVTHGPGRIGDVRHSRADITLIRKMLGYEPTVDLAAGLHAML